MPAATQMAFCIQSGVLPSPDSPTTMLTDSAGFRRATMSFGVWVTYFFNSAYVRLLRHLLFGSSRSVSVQGRIAAAFLLTFSFVSGIVHQSPLAFWAALPSGP